MAIFDYRGEDGREVIAEAYQLATYTTTAPLDEAGLSGLTGLIIHDPSEEAFQLPEGWSELTAAELGIDASYVEDGGFFGFGDTPYFTDDGTLIDGEAKVLVKRDANGNVTNLAISFAATNSIGSVIDFQALSDLSYADRFEYLYEAVRDYAVDHDLTGRDVLFTGYSLGGGATNLAAIKSGAIEGQEARLDGFFAESDYIGFASPAIADAEVLGLDKVENIFNFGLENDVVYRVGGNDINNPPSLLEAFLNPNADVESTTSVDNVVLFNSSYASNAFPFGYFGLLNLVGWFAHIDGAVAGPRIFETISTSNFYDYMEQDSTIILSNLPDGMRNNVWVEPVDRVTGNHVGDDSFVLGSVYDDKLGDSSGNDFLDGFEGDDRFRLSEGNDTVHGGEGQDRVDMEGSLGDYEIMRLSDGTTFFLDTKGRYGLEQLIDVEQVNFGFAQTYDLEDGAVKWGWFKAADYEDVTEGTSSSELLEGTSSGDRIFGLEGDDTLLGHEGNDLLHGGDGADALSGGIGNDQLFGAAGDDIIYGGEGDDILSGGLGSDTFVFTANSGDDVITDYNMGEQGDDLIAFSVDVFAGYEDVIAASSQQGDDVLIAYGEDSLLLEGTSLDSLTEEQFIFA